MCLECKELICVDAYDDGEYRNDGDDDDDDDDDAPAERLCFGASSPLHAAAGSADACPLDGFTLSLVSKF